ncbi:unnamed protein product [Didymodactylos carnosus]|uniref:Sacsin/Nov domain-containing protein n=1 Tax=Didymodactylos carnosus TaxID=1234261 RepID=A0A8S2JBE4_9BILA|nr:unnamed protein product [Didymodactylos carnosus]CAF3803095.1 unnamed protein product [Didymodactylos carnosus]
MKICPHLQRIVDLGEGSKNNNVHKIGRYGVGFNTVYHVTDVPTFMSSDKFVIFDPLLKYMPCVTTNNPGRQCDAKLIERFPDVFQTFLPDIFDLKKGTMFRLPLRASISEISGKVYSDPSIINLLDSLVDELPKCVLFLRNIRSVKLSKLNKNGEICSIEEVTVCPQGPDDEASIHTVSNILSNIQNRSALLEGNCHSIHTYSVDISSTKSGKQSYLIANGIGFTSGIQKSLYKDFLENFDQLKCLPVGACAYLLNDTSVPSSPHSTNSDDEQKRKELNKEHFIYCFLPLPVCIDIPMHVHGYFCLSNESRYDLWKSDIEKDTKRLWNEALAEYLLSQCYVEVVCLTAKQVQNQSLSIEHYLALFVNAGTIENNLIKLLIENAYETFFSRALTIIPTLNIASKASFAWTHVSNPKLYFITAFESYVRNLVTDEDKYPAYINDCHHSLLLIDTKICQERRLIDRIKHDKKSMRDLTSVHLCNELRMYSSHNTNVSSIDDTVFTHKSLYIFLSFVLLDEKVRRGQLNGCPLLLRADNKVSCFDKNNTLYGFQHVSTFQTYLDRFMHPTLLNLFKTEELQKCWLRELKINDLADMLPKVLDKDKFCKNGHELFTECEVDVDVKIKDILNIWLILENNLRSVLPVKGNSESDRNDVKRVLLKELEPIKYWCLIPIQSHNGESSKHKKVHFAPFTVVDMIFYEDYGSRVELYYLSKAKVQVLNTTFFYYEDDLNQDVINILKYLVQDIGEPTQVLDVLSALSDRTPDFYKKLDDEAYGNILIYCNSILTSCRAHQNPEFYALKIEKLPIFMNIYGHYERLSDKKRIYVSSQMPLNHLNEVSRRLDMQFLKHRGDVQFSIQKYLKIKFMDVYALYGTILDCLTSAELMDRVEHMKYLRTKYEPFDCKDNTLKLKLQSFKFIKDTDENIRSASYFYDHNNEVFQLALPSSRFLVGEFRKKEWLQFLSYIGLQTEVNQANALFVMKELSKKNMLDENGVQAAFSIMKGTQQYSDQFFEQASLIEFIPNAVNDELMQIVQASPRLIATKNACTHKKASLCWTEVGILPEKLASLDEKILKQCKICQQPELETIIQCIEKVSQRFTNDNDISEENYLILLKLCQEWCRALVELGKENKEKLRNTRFIPMKRINVNNTLNVRLVAPDDIFIRTTEWHDTIWPYFFAIDVNDKDYKQGIIAFLLALPVENKPSCSHCIRALKNLYEKSPQKILDPNDRVTVVKAILYYMRSEMDDDRPECEKAITYQDVYLPNLCFILTSSQQLHYIDQPKYKNLISKSEQIKQLCFCHILFGNYLEETASSNNNARLENKIRQLESDCKGNRIKRYFPHLTPISDILDERVNEDCVTDDSIEVSSLAETIHTSEFYRAISRIVQHFFPSKSTEENIGKLIQFLHELEIYITKEPIKASIFNKKTNQMIDNSQIELLKHLKKIYDDGYTSYILYIYDISKKNDTTRFCDEVTETIQQQCYTTFCENVTSTKESHRLFKVIRDIIRGDVQDYEKLLNDHNIQEGEETVFDNLTFVPKLGSLVELADLQYLVPGIQSCAPRDYIAREVHTSDDADEIVEDLDNIMEITEYPPEYRHARITKLIEDHENDFEKKYEVEIEPRKYEIISAVYLYRFNKPSLNEIPMRNNDDIVNNKQIMLTNMPTTEEDEAHRFACSEALKEQIDKDVQKIKPLAGKERRTAIRRLMLEYHPDKHMKQIPLYVVAFQYLQQCLARLFNLGDASTDQTQGNDERNFHFTNSSRSGYTYEGRKTNFSYYFGSATQSHRRERRKNPQPSTALKWLLQARYNLKELLEYRKRDIYLWCCIKSYYVALDVIHCVMIADDWNSVRQTSTLSGLNANCENNSVKTLSDANRACQLAEELCKKAEKVFKFN